MNTYYCLVAGFPDISLDDGKLSCSVEDFKIDIYPQLASSDKKLVDLFYLKFDNQNLLSLLKDREAQVKTEGTLTEEELSTLIETVRNGDIPNKKYPVYLSEFVSQYITLSSEDLYKAEDLLTSLYYQYAMSCKNQFISDWFEFNLNVNNILSAYTARKYKIDIAPVIVGQTFVCEQLRTSNARDFGLTDTLDYMDQMQRISETEELVERERKIDMLKWKWLENHSFFHYFTIERIFVFLMHLEMTERWVLLDKQKGYELFRQMIQNLKEEISIPDEFKNNKTNR